VLAAFHAAPGKGSLTLDGRLLDRPHVRLAERLLAAVPHRGSNAGST